MFSLRAGSELKPTRHATGDWRPCALRRRQRAEGEEAGTLSVPFVLLRLLREVAQSPVSAGSPSRRAQSRASCALRARRTQAAACSSNTSARSRQVSASEAPAQQGDPPPPPLSAPARRSPAALTHFARPHRPLLQHGAARPDQPPTLRAGILFTAGIQAAPRNCGFFVYSARLLGARGPGGASQGRLAVGRPSSQGGGHKVRWEAARRAPTAPGLPPPLAGMRGALGRSAPQPATTTTRTLLCSRRRLLLELGGALGTLGDKLSAAVARLHGVEAARAQDCASLQLMSVAPVLRECCTLAGVAGLSGGQLARFVQCGALLVGDATHRQLAGWQAQYAAQMRQPAAERQGGSRAAGRQAGQERQPAMLFNRSTVPVQLEAAKQLLRLLGRPGEESSLAAFAASVWTTERLSRWLAAVLDVVAAAMEAGGQRSRAVPAVPRTLSWGTCLHPRCPCPPPTCRRLPPQLRAAPGGRVGCSADPARIPAASSGCAS